MKKGNVRVGEFDYVNRTYGLSLVRGTRLKFTGQSKDDPRTGRKGTVASGDGQYIMILVDGDLKPSGPFHPTSGILYEDDLRSKEPDYPEHRKLEAVHEKSQAVGSFIDWLMTEKKIEFAFYHKHGPGCQGWNAETGKIDRVYKYDCNEDHKHDPIFCERHLESGCDMPEETMVSYRMGENTIQKLLAEFFEIDQHKLEVEKDAMLASLRSKQSG